MDTKKLVEAVRSGQSAEEVITQLQEGLSTYESPKGIVKRFRIADIPSKIQKLQHSDKFKDAMIDAGVYLGDWQWFDGELGFDSKSKRSQALKVLKKL